MATKSPTVMHNQWPNVSDPTELPNVSGASIQDQTLEKGDQCFSLSDSTTYQCTLETLGAATWSAMGGGAPAAHATTHEPGGGDTMAVDAAAGTGSLRTLGTGATNACAGNDARLSDARTPTSHASSHDAGGGDAMAIDAAAGTGSLRTLGTGSTNACAGNDSRLSDARTPTSHASTHEPGGGDAMAVDAAAGTGSLRTLGTGATNACAGNDSRLSDARTPTSHASTHEPGGGDAMAVDAVAATGSLRTLGTGAAQACAGDDSRLSDARTPTSHATSHQSGGGDAIKLDDLASPDDNTDLNASTSAHGLLLKLSGNTAEYLTGAGAWSTPVSASLSNTAPEDVDPQAASAGVATEASRRDHKHDVVTATAGAITPGDTAAEGTADSVARSDHQHSIADFGAAANTFCEGNDSRLSDARTPTSHNTSHQSGGGDAIKLDDLATPDDNTDLNASTSAHGLLRKLSGTATEYLDGSGAWSTPAGGGGGVGGESSNLWAHPSSPHAQDDEFESTSLTGWSVQNLGAAAAGSFSANTIDIYDTTFTSGNALRVNAHTNGRRSWLLMQPPASGDEFAVYKSYTLPTNLLMYARLKNSIKRVGSAIDDSNIGLAFMTASTGVPTTASRVVMYLNNTASGVYSAECVWYTTGGSASGSQRSTDVDTQGQALAVMAIHKVGTDYHMMVGTEDGNWIWLATYDGSTFGFTPDMVGFVCENVTTTNILNFQGADFIRFIETDKFLL